MEAFIYYILMSTSCISLCYIVFLLLPGKEKNLRSLRLYLLISMFLALLMPLSSYKIEFEFQKSDHQITEFSRPSENNNPILGTGFTLRNEITSSQESLSLKQVLFLLYLMGMAIILIRMLMQLFTILRYFMGSRKAYLENIPLLVSKRIDHPFSFFRWIFILPETLQNSDHRNMIVHENIHAKQYHSADLLLVELLSALMWFNPLVWMMRRSVQLVHEYLADEGVLSTGTDKLRYQALLINQVAEDRLISLSSGFNHSLIKKRIIMMTKNKFYQNSKSVLFALLPLAMVLFIAVACVKGQDSSNTVTAIAPVKMNVLYLGVDNPITIAASGYKPSDLTVTVTNGRISGENGNYIIRCVRTGTSDVTVSYNGKEIQKTTFRVKTVPNPVAVIETKEGMKKEGKISKAELLDAKGVTVFMEFFDFDLKFVATSFVMSVTVPNSTEVKEEISHSEQYSEQQIDLINSLVVNQKLMFEEIEAVGPDGSTRKMNTMVFTIVE